uniref:NADH-ubiquinone oxidoreductase chain 1 n=1 Tax=Peripatoides sp. DVL-2010 TaxID=867919 RepID=F8RJ98_9BILA|nr:NADH dehydrogenase subunit 1 [Peripatoides sp. DVL-2010]
MMLYFLILFICVLISVAFLTLLERKFLGYFQIRKGPNKVSMIGMLQPFSDAIKLFTKEQIKPIEANLFSYYLSPFINMLIAIVLWIIFPSIYLSLNFSLGLIFFLCCISMSVYTIMGAGWSSNSKYALLGALRAVAQTISYEVSLALILLNLIIMSECFNFNMFNYNQIYMWYLIMFFPLFYCWMSSILAETNRAPFDFAEGESELVSGFNIEYSSGSFALIFMAEYANILFMSMISAILFLGSINFLKSNDIFLIIKLMTLSFWFIWVRGIMPRFRYDKLMYLAWKSILPLSLNYLIMCLFFKMFLNMC